MMIQYKRLSLSLSLSLSLFFSPNPQKNETKSPHLIHCTSSFLFELLVSSSQRDQPPTAPPDLLSITLFPLMRRLQQYIVDAATNNNSRSPQTHTHSFPLILRGSAKPPNPPHGREQTQPISTHTNKKNMSVPPLPPPACRYSRGLKSKQVFSFLMTLRLTSPPPPPLVHSRNTQPKSRAHTRGKGKEGQRRVRRGRRRERTARGAVGGARHTGGEREGVTTQ